MKSLDEKINEAKLVLAKLELEKKKFDELPYHRRLAEKLHSKFCFGCGDSCSWHYEKWGDCGSGSEHTKYELAARELIRIYGPFEKNVDVEVTKFFNNLEIVRGY